MHRLMTVRACGKDGVSVVDGRGAVMIFRAEAYEGTMMLEVNKNTQEHLRLYGIAARIVQFCVRTDKPRYVERTN